MSDSFTRPNFCEINLNSLCQNYRLLRERAEGRDLLAIVKANAYGHGAVSISRILEKEGASFFGVASFEEGVLLRQSGIKTPILCLGGPFLATREDFLEYKLTPIVFSFETFAHLRRSSKKTERPLRIHLKIDTGMGRLGFFLKELPEILDLLKKEPSFELEGVLTHFSSSEDPNPETTEKQLLLFSDVMQQIKAFGFKPLFFHEANSGGILSNKMSQTNLVRPGIALYGAYPHPRFKEKVSLDPVLAWKTKVISLKNFPQGAALSYNETFVTKRPSRIAVIAVGYADGYPRSLSNCGEVLIEGFRAPIVGRVCMDWTLVDVTEIPAAKIGSEVVLVGSQKNQTIRVEELAQKAQTISYEIFCRISERVRRVYL